MSIPKPKRRRGLTIPAPDTMVISAFRYCLSRQSYIVRDCTTWLHNHWDAIPINAQHIIMRELEEAFDRDDEARAKGEQYLPLGHDCDRASWAFLRRKYKTPLCCQCKTPMDETRMIGVVHVDGECSCAFCHDNRCVVCSREFKNLEEFIPVGRKGRHPGCALPATTAAAAE